MPLSLDLTIGGDKNAPTVVPSLLLGPPTCVAGNEGSSALVVSSPSFGARGERLGMPGSREICIKLTGVAILAVQEPEIQLLACAHSHLSCCCFLKFHVLCLGRSLHK